MKGGSIGYFPSRQRWESTVRNTGTITDRYAIFEAQALNSLLIRCIDTKYGTSTYDPDRKMWAFINDRNQKAYTIDEILQELANRRRFLALSIAQRYFLSARHLREKQGNKFGESKDPSHKAVYESHIFYMNRIDSIISNINDILKDNRNPLN